MKLNETAIRLLISLSMLGALPIIGEADEPIPDFGPEGPIGVSNGSEMPQFQSDTRRTSVKTKGLSQFQLLQAALKRLNLSEDQKGQVALLMDEFRTQGADLRSKISRLQDTIKMARLQDDASPAVEIVREEIASIMKRSKSLTGKTQESILNILTDEQREKFNQIRGRLTKRSNAQSPL